MPRIFALQQQASRSLCPILLLPSAAATYCRLCCQSQQYRGLVQQQQQQQQQPKLEPVRFRLSNDPVRLSVPQLKLWRIMISQIGHDICSCNYPFTELSECIQLLAERISSGQSLATGLPFRVADYCNDEVMRFASQMTASQLAQVAASRDLLIKRGRIYLSADRMNYEAVDGPATTKGSCYRFEYTDLVIGCRLSPRAPKAYRKRLCQCRIPEKRLCHLRPVCELGERLLACGNWTPAKLREALHSQSTAQRDHSTDGGQLKQQILDDFIANSFIWLLNWTVCLPVWPLNDLPQLGRQIRLSQSGLDYPSRVRVLSGLNLLLVKDFLSGDVRFR